MTKVPSRIVSNRAKPDVSIQYSGKSPSGGMLITTEISYEAMALLQSALIKDANGVEEDRWAFFPLTQVDLVKRALLGDHEPLIRYFAEGNDLTSEERALVADIALGNLPKPQSCPPKIETEARAKAIATFAQVLKYLGGNRVADIAAAKFGVDRSYVSKLVKEHRGVGWSAIFLAGLIVALGGSQGLGRAMMRRFAGITDADMEEAARKRKRRK